MRPEGDAAAAAAAAVWWRFYQAAAALRRVLEDAVAPAGVSPAQAQLLLLLHTDAAARAQPMTRLARTLPVAPEGMSVLVNLMEGRGLVQRVYDLPDRRAVRVELTAAGMVAAEALLAQVEDVVARCLAGLTAAEVQKLVALLTRVTPATDAAEYA